MLIGSPITLCNTGWEGPSRFADGQAPQDRALEVVGAPGCVLQHLEDPRGRLLIPLGGALQHIVQKLERPTAQSAIRPAVWGIGNLWF